MNIDDEKEGLDPREEDGSENKAASAEEKPGEEQTVPEEEENAGEEETTERTQEVVSEENGAEESEAREEEIAAEEEEEDDEHEEVNEIPVFSEEDNETEAVDAASENKEHSLDSVEGYYTKEASQKPREDSGYFKSLSYHNDGASTIDNDIESRRTVFNKTYRSNKICSIVIMIVLLIFFVGIILVAFLDVADWIMWTVLGVGVGFIIIALIVSKVLSDRVSKKAMVYLHEYQDVVSSYLVGKLGITDATLGCDATIDDQDFIQAHYFSTINSITSRAVVVGQKDNHNINMAEICVNVPPRTFDDANRKPEDLYKLDGSRYDASLSTDLNTSTQEVPTTDMTMVDIDIASDEKQEKKKARKRQAYEKDANNATEVGLFGRFIAYDFKVRSEQSFIITVMGDKQYTMLPDYTTGFYAVKVSGLKSNIVVYAVQPVLVGDIFDREAVDILNSITVSTNVQSLFISCNSYGTRIGLNLSDPMVELPVEKNPPLGGLDELAETLNRVFDFVGHTEEMTKNSNL